MLKTMTDANFDGEVVCGKGIQVTMFFTEECPYCKAMMPTFEQISNMSEFPTDDATPEDSRFTFSTIDALKNMDASDNYGVQAVPQIIIFKNGEIVDSLLGAKPADELAEKLRFFLPSKPEVVDQPKAE